MDNDLISRSALKEKMWRSAVDTREKIAEIIDNAPTVELTEEQAIDKLYETGWIIRHDKEMTERPQGEWVVQRLQNGFDDVYCPFCNARPTRSEYGYYLLDKFCHDCGARLEGYAGGDVKE